MDIKKFCRKMNNRGSTLIEIIVSVLIIGIAFVPLLMGLTTALKANTRAEEMLHGETVAANCIEVVKTYGMKDFSTVNADLLSADDITGSGSSFTATGIQEGTSTYNVEILFSDTQADGSAIPLNQKKYDSFNSITGAYTVTSSKTADDTRLEAYRVTAGTNEDTYAVPDTLETKDLVFRKQTVITIDRFLSGENSGYWHIDSSTAYLLRNSKDGKFFFEKDKDYIAFEDTAKSVQLCSDVASEYPDTILLFYSPIASSSSLNTGTNKEYIIIENNTGKEVDVYVFVNGVDVKYDGSLSDVNMYFGFQNSTGSKTNVYCTARPASFANIYSTTADKGYIDKLYYKTDSSSPNPSLHPSWDTSKVSGVSAATTIPAVLDDDAEADAKALLAKASGKKLYNVKVVVKDLGGTVVASKDATIIE